MPSFAAAYGLLRFVQEHAPARLDAIAEERADLVARVIALDDEAAQLRRQLDFSSLPRPAGTLRPDLEGDAGLPRIRDKDTPGPEQPRAPGYSAPLRRVEG